VVNFVSKRSPKSEERHRACHLHTGLTYLRGGRTRNSTSRKRFGVEPRNAALV